jgi:hypothetical protein
VVHLWGVRGAPEAQAARAEVAKGLGRHGTVFGLRQAHGATIKRWRACDEPAGQAVAADAAMTTEPRVLLAIETADCLPIFIIDPKRRFASAAHAGWKGTALGVAAIAARALIDLGSSPSDLRVALGPSIGPCCYEVGAEVRAALPGEEWAFYKKADAGKWMFDLRLANRAQLLREGIKGARIEDAPFCTRCREDLFFSYRRDGPRAGRMISVAGWA